MRELIDQLYGSKELLPELLEQLLEDATSEDDQYLFRKADEVRQKYFGKDIYVRGLIELTSYCKNNCYYCGIRRSNKKAERYRLTHGQILDCCQKGYELGFRTFVLQGGEDPYYKDELLEDIVRDIKEHYWDCAITLSLGERSYDSYLRLYRAGADRYLLRHETANEEHYRFLHPEEMSYDNRRKCLRDLKEIGYQTGCGIMVGSPGQKISHLVEDIRFIREFRPEMVGIGPFIHHRDTPFASYGNGSLEMTLRLLAIIRLVHPKVLLPATTALATIFPKGREMGIQAGANVVMPNLSPEDVRKSYLLYDNKACTGDEAAEALENLRDSMLAIGYRVVTDRGDYKG